MKIFICLSILLFLNCQINNTVPTEIKNDQITSFDDPRFDDPPNDMPNSHLDSEAWEAWSRLNDSLYIKYLDSLNSNSQM